MKRHTPQQKRRDATSKSNVRQPKNGSPLPVIPLTDQGLSDFAQALRENSELIAQGEALLKLELERIPLLSGADLDEVTRACVQLENFLHSERSATCEVVLGLYRLSMTYLTVHGAATDAGVRDFLTENQPEYLEYQPQALSPEDLEHYKSLAVLTAEFLKARTDGVCCSGMK